MPCPNNMPTYALLGIQRIFSPNLYWQYPHNMRIKLKLDKIYVYFYKRSLLMQGQLNISEIHYLNNKSTMRQLRYIGRVYRSISIIWLLILALRMHFII
jgi:hypothetical protein